MKVPTPPASSIKKRPSKPPRSKMLSLTTMTGSGRNLYKMQKEETHEEMMQRFQLRKVASDRALHSTFKRGQHVVIDKATATRSRKSRRFSCRRFVRAIYRPKARQQLLSKLLTPITPKSWTSTLHGILMLVVYHFQLLYLPFAPSYFPLGSLYSHATNAMLETVFLLDILLNFNTAIVEQGVLVTSRKKIASKFMRKWWFLVDFLSAIPLQVIYVIATRSIYESHSTLRKIQTTLMVVRILRVTFFEKGVLLNRVTRVAHHLTEWMRYSRYSHLLGIAQLMWLVLLIAHYMACLWHSVSKDQSSQARQDDSVAEKYVADYYYAVSLIQGQGNAIGSWEENLFSSGAIIAGSVILAIVFGNVAMLVSNFNANTTNYHRKMEAVYATMDKMDLPLTLRDRVNEYYTHVWLEYEALDGNINKFQHELTHTLRIEIGLYKFMNLIVKIPFWDNCTPDFLTQLVLNLGVRVYMPDDYVVRRREIGSEMMMINLGYCKLSKPLSRPKEAKEVGTEETIPASDNALAKPVLSPQDFGSGSGLDSDDSNDQSDDETSEEEDEELNNHAFTSPRNIRRTSGSVFKLPVEMNEVTTGAYPRRHRNPSSIPNSVELEQPKRFFAYLGPGQAFGEMSLLMNYKRQATVRAVTFVEMCVLDRKTFQSIISRYPEDRRRVLTKMLESCIAKKEIPFPWENIIEAATAKHRNSGIKESTRSSVIATMTAGEAARILVEAIDVNVPDDSIKYGFQSFEQDFVEEPNLRRAYSVGAKIRDTLQRTNSGLRDSLHRSNRGLTLQWSNSGLSPVRPYSRRNSCMDSGRSSSKADLTELEAELSTSSPQRPGTSEKFYESMMQFMHTMVEKMDLLQNDVTELKRQRRCCKQCSGVSEPADQRLPASSIMVSKHAKPTTVAKPEPECAEVLTRQSSDLKSKQETSISRKSSLLDMLPSTIRSKSQQNSDSTVSVATHINLVSARTGMANSAQTSQLSSKSKTSGSKISPRLDAFPTTLMDGQETRIQGDPYANPRSSRQLSRTKSGRQQTLADYLWKRANTNGESSKQSRQTLKSRHSLPAGGNVTDVASGPNEMPPRPYEQHSTVNGEKPEGISYPRGQIHSNREFSRMTISDASKGLNPDPRYLTINE